MITNNSFSLQKNMRLVGLSLVLFLSLQTVSASDKSLKFETRLSGPMLIIDAPEFHALKDRQEHHAVPAVSLIVMDKGQVVVSKGYGSLGDGVVPDADTVYQVGSISKPLAASVALAMAETGLIDLDTDLKAILTAQGFQLGDFEQQVNLEMLFGHIAGFNVSGFSGFAPGATLPTLQDIINGRAPAKEDAIYLDPDQVGDWSYSGGGYVAAQVALEYLTQHSYESQAQSRLFDSLGMKRSSFQNPPANAQIAHGYTSEGEVAGGWTVYPQPTAASLWSSASDMALWLQAIHASFTGKNGHWGASQIKYLWKMITDVGAFRQGLGFRWGGEGKGLWISANGDTKGYHARVILFPETGDGLVLMTNAGNEQASPFADELVRAVANVYDWPHFQPKLKTLMTEDTITWDPVVGHYVFEYSDQVSLRVEVDESGNGWMVIVNGEEIGERRPLYASDDGNFFTIGGSELVLESGEEGEVAMQLVQGAGSWGLIRQTRE